MTTLFVKCNLYFVKKLSAKQGIQEHGLNASARALNCYGYFEKIVEMLCQHTMKAKKKKLGLRIV